MKNTNHSQNNDYLNTSSATDCTGLIPASPAGDEELENYEELYPFLPEAVVKTKEHSQNNKDESAAIPSLQSHQKY